MKKLIFAISTLLLFAITACNNNSGISDNGHSFLPPYERYELKTGPQVNAILKELGAYTSNVTKIKASTQPPAQSIPRNKIKYIDCFEEDVLCWLDESAQTIYYYADDVTTAGGTKKIKLSPDSSGLFYNCCYVTAIDLAAFDTSKVNNMYNIFYSCRNLSSLDLSSFETSKVTNMAGMFSGCSNLTSLNLSHFDTSKVTDMSDMFGCCEKLIPLDLSSFNTSNVKNMRGMFAMCYKMYSINLSSFDTSNVQDMSYMFALSERLSSLDFSSFNTSNVKDMSYMFEACDRLTSLDLSSFNTSNVSNMTCMFDYCSNLQTIIASESFVTSNVTNSNYMFYSSALVGGSGTTFDASHTDKEYARIDGGPTSATPGYFTRKTNP